MSFRFWRRIKVAPGMTVNLSKSGGSLSLGPRGAKITRGFRGDRATIGIPGTGLFYTSKLANEESARSERSSSSAAAIDESPTEERLTLGFFKRLVTPAEEEALVDGCRELFLGEEEKALAMLERAVHLADGLYIAGVVALNLGRLEEAARYLTGAAERHRELGRTLSRYGIEASMNLPITDEVVASLDPDLRGVLLALVEVHQRRKRWPDAIACLEKLQSLEPDDVVVKLSLAELLLEARPDDKESCERILLLAEGVENETPVHGALLLYKARALRALGLPEAAREALTKALRRKKDRPDELLQALRYDRALVYEELGRRKEARRDFERLYAEAPGYEDVAERLGL